MATKRPVVLDTATGTLKEIKPPDQIPADVLPASSGQDFAFFMS